VRIVRPVWVEVMTRGVPRERGRVVTACLLDLAEVLLVEVGGEGCRARAGACARRREVYGGRRLGACAPALRRNACVRHRRRPGRRTQTSGPGERPV
jgi:hypothetical protein